jgi:hypothetical protein
MLTLGEHVQISGDLALALERDVKRSAVRLVRYARRLGISRAEVSRAIGVDARTLREWDRRWRVERLRVRAPGPVRRELTRAQRQSALWALWRTSGRIGIAELKRAVWPPAPRAALVDLKRRWRYAAHRRGGRLCAVVQWLRAGSVWAMDWTDPPRPVEGTYRKILSVRDVASGRQLCALPCVKERGTVVARELARLIARYGAPAAVKMDNGGSVCCTAVRLVLAQHGILMLVSPPACPGYNGACEAGIGSLKTIAVHLARPLGHEDEWSCDDVEAARAAQNARVRASGLSADDVWSTRRPVRVCERERLWSSYRSHFAAEYLARGIAPNTALPRFEQASVDRAAIARALEEHGLVRFRRRWIRPPIRGRKVSRKW